MHDRINGRYHWLCRCDCGTETTPYGGSLVAGLTTSCGCLKRERTSATHTTHGHTRGRSQSRAYRAWFAMLARVKRDPHYTERGIGVAPRWKNFENFLADMGEPPPGTSLDRIDNDGDYGPGACRWATHAQQMRNTRSTRLISFRGETLCRKDWATRAGISRSTLDYRLERGWSLERALTEPARSH